MDRRNFLKTGGIALLGSLTTGSAMALATPGALGGEGADKKATVALAMNHFGVSEADLKKCSLQHWRKEATTPIFSLNTPLQTVSA